MTNVLSVNEWLRVVREEYLSGLIQDGGASTKFVVPESTGLLPLLKSELTREAVSLNYQAFNVDGGETRVHMPHEVFFRIARQIDWGHLSRLVILRLCNDAGYRTDAIDPQSETLVIRAVSHKNAVEESQVALDVRRRLPEAVTRNREMSRDFRLAMTHLCLTEISGDAGNEIEATPLLDWLTGANRRVSNVRPYQIFNTITRTNARHFLQSLLKWLQLVGYSGAVVLLDISRLTLRQNPRDDLIFYSRPAVMDHYEFLREVIDSSDQLEGLLLVAMANEDFLDPDERGKGYSIYRALMGRIADEVRSRDQANPMAALVRLADTV